MTGEKHPGQLESIYFKLYIRIINELSAKYNMLLWGYRIIIPPLLRGSVLTKLHETQPGIYRMKFLARSYVWWPGIDDEVESLVKTCTQCQYHRNMPQRAPIHPCAHPSNPWNTLHIDYAGCFQGKMYLVVMDSYSKWLDPVNSANSSVNIEKLKILFATHGLPEIVVSDNASCFKSEEFGIFTRKNNICDITGSPYHLQTNGVVERCVKSFKQSISKLLETNINNESIQTLISRLLITYRITPHSTTGVSPAELLMGRKLNNALFPKNKYREKIQDSK